MITSIPKDKLDGLLDESFKAFNGAGYDLQSLADSTSRIAGDANGVADRTSRLIDDAQPVLESQVVSADALRTWSSRLASVSRQLVANDPEIRAVLDTGPAAAQEVSRLLDQVKPTLPVLLANLTSLGQVAVTYRPGLDSSSFCFHRPPPSTSRRHRVRTRPASPWATSGSRSAIRRRAPWGFCRRRRGGPPPTPPPSTLRTASTANSPRIRR